MQEWREKNVFNTHELAHLVPEDDFDPLENRKAWRNPEDNLLVLPETMQEKFQRRKQEYCRSYDKYWISTRPFVAHIIESRKSFLKNSQNYFKIINIE